MAQAPLRLTLGKVTLTVGMRRQCHSQKKSENNSKKMDQSLHVTRCLPHLLILSPNITPKTRLVPYYSKRGVPFLRGPWNFRNDWRLQLCPPRAGMTGPTLSTAQLGQVDWEGNQSLHNTSGRVLRPLQGVDRKFLQPAHSGDALPGPWPSPQPRQAAGLPSTDHSAKIPCRSHQPPAASQGRKKSRAKSGGGGGGGPKGVDGSGGLNAGLFKMWGNLATRVPQYMPTVQLYG